MPLKKPSAFGQRRCQASVDDIELVIIEHDLCFHCHEQRGCLRRESTLRTATQQGLSFIVTRCPDFEEA